MTEALKPCQPLAGGSNDGLGVNAALVPCPLCGGEDGYRVHEGSTYRWRNLLCAVCGEMVAEARNTAKPHEIPTDSKPRYSAGDEAWNAAGAYAQGLRDNRDRAVRLLHLSMAQLRRWGDAHGRPFECKLCRARWRKTGDR